MHVMIQALHRPSKPTGVCRYAANLAHCLADLDCISRISLLIGQWQVTYFEKSFHFESPKIQIIDIDIKNSSVMRNWWFMFRLPQFSKQLKPDIIHMSFPFPFVRQWFNVPVVSTIHDLYPYEYPENFGYPQVWFNQLFLRQCIKNSDGLSCVSKCTLESLETHFSEIRQTKQREVIYNYVDFTNILPKMPNQLKHNNSPFLLAVAQHRKNKNLDLLLHSYKNLLNNHSLPPDTKLIIIGSEGPETKKLLNLVEILKIKKGVTFLSGLGDEELRWLYEHAQLFIIPSSTEGFCLPLAEALTLFCPVVCSDIPILREVGSENCIYFKLDSYAIRNLSKAINQSLSKDISKAVTRNQIFSKNMISQRILSFYDSIL